MIACIIAAIAGGLSGFCLGYKSAWNVAMVYSEKKMKEFSADLTEYTKQQYDLVAHAYKHKFNEMQRQINRLSK